MNRLLDYPALVFALSFFALWLSARVGVFLRKKRALERDVSSDFSTILVSTLTLNGLIIGFTFSMAMSRYEERKSYEVLEANAIRAEYLRADLLSAADAYKVQSLLRIYLGQRISFYTARRNERELRDIDIRTVQLQTILWSALRDAGVAQPTPTMALAVAGMNDVLNSQGYAPAAWWNRIPPAAWILMAAVTVIANVFAIFAKAAGIPDTSILWPSLKTSSVAVNAKTPNRIARLCLFFKVRALLAYPPCKNGTAGCDTTTRKGGIRHQNRLKKLFNRTISRFLSGVDRLSIILGIG